MAKGWLTRSYNFIDKDPEIDVFRTLYQKQRIKETDLAMLAGLSVGCVKALFGGETRQPRHSTFGKLAGAMGASYKLTQDDMPDYQKEIPKARLEYKAHKEALAKKRERAQKRNGGKR